jgi:flavoprotein
MLGYPAYDYMKCKGISQTNKRCCYPAIIGGYCLMHWKVEVKKAEIKRKVRNSLPDIKMISILK